MSRGESDYMHLTAEFGPIYKLSPLKNIKLQMFLGGQKAQLHPQLPVVAS